MLSGSTISAFRKMAREIRKDHAKDMWNAYWDMFTALTDSLADVFTFSSWQDKLINESERHRKG